MSKYTVVKTVPDTQCYVVSLNYYLNVRLQYLTPATSMMENNSL